MASTMYAYLFLAPEARAATVAATDREVFARTGRAVADARREAAFTDILFDIEKATREET